MPSDELGVNVAQTRHYDDAPIVEATVSFEFGALADEKLAILERLGEALHADYPTVEPYRDFRRTARDSIRPVDGYKYSSADGKQLVQISLNTFSFSRLTPYERWEVFIAEARRTWNVCRDAASIDAIESFRLRFLNELKIPAGVPLHEFFNVFPAMPNRDILFNQIYLFVESNLSELPGIVQTRMLPAKPTGNEARIILDNEFVFYVSKEENVWNNIDVIQKIKNDTFESQITDRMREALR